MKPTEQNGAITAVITAQLLPVTQELMQPKRDLQTSIATTQA